MTNQINLLKTHWTLFR